MNPDNMVDSILHAGKELDVLISEEVKVIHNLVTSIPGQSITLTLPARTQWKKPYETKVLNKYGCWQSKSGLSTIRFIKINSTFRRFEDQLDFLSGPTCDFFPNEHKYTDIRERVGGIQPLLEMMKASIIDQLEGARKGVAASEQTSQEIIDLIKER